MNHSDEEKLAKEVDKKVEAFEKRLQKLVEAIEVKDSVIVKLEQRLINIENQNNENKRKLKDCETSLKKMNVIFQLVLGKV